MTQKCESATVKVKILIDDLPYTNPTIAGGVVRGRKGEVRWMYRKDADRELREAADKGLRRPLEILADQSS